MTQRVTRLVRCKDKNNFSILQIIRHHFARNSCTFRGRGGAFFAEVEGLEDFDAELHQLVQEIVGGTDVEREIGVARGGRIGVGDFPRLKLLLRMMEGQRAHAKICKSSEIQRKNTFFSFISE